MQQNPFYNKDYYSTIKFVNEKANSANEQDHHPVLLVEFDKETVLWWKH